MVFRLVAEALNAGVRNIAVDEKYRVQLMCMHCSLKHVIGKMIVRISASAHAWHHWLGIFSCLRLESRIGDRGFSACHLFSSHSSYVSTRLTDLCTFVIWGKKTLIST